MPKTTDDEEQSGVFALIKGPPGTGKSVLADSFPNVFTLDLDRKMPTIARKHFPGKKFYWDTYPDVFKVADQLNEWYVHGCPYETLVTDSITSLSTMCLNSSAKVLGKTVTSMMQTLTTTTGGGKQSEAIPISFYNDELRFFIGFYMDMMRTLWARPGNPKHVLFIAHLVVTESAPDLRTKMVTTTRSIVTAGRKVASTIPTCFDEEWIVGYELPDLGDNLTPEKRICITSRLGDDNARTAYRLTTKIDFTNKSFYDLAVAADPNVAGRMKQIGTDVLDAEIVEGKGSL